MVYGRVILLIGVLAGLCACAQMRPLPGDAVVVADSEMALLRFRTGVDRVVFRLRLGDVCVHEGRSGADQREPGQWSFMATDRNRCARLDPPYVSIDSHDARALELAHGLIFGSRRPELARALRDKSQWEAATNLDDRRLAGTFLHEEDGSLRLVVPGETSMLIRFTTLDPLHIEIERWQ